MTPEVKERIEQIRHGNVPEGFIREKKWIIPCDWKLSCGSNLFSFIRNGFVGTVTPYYVESGVRYLQGTNIKEGRIVIDETFFVTEEFHEAHPNSQLKCGDVVVVQSGAVGESAVIDEYYHGGNCHALIIMTPNADTSPVWYSSLLNSPLRRDLLAGIITGNTIRHILASDMKSLAVPTPEYVEQKCIAEIVSVQERIIYLKEKLLTEKQRQKKYLMQQLLTGKKRLPGFDGEWMYVRANQIFKNVTDKKHDGTMEVLSATQDRGIIPRSQVDIDIKYAEESLTGYKKVVKGNFVISLRSFQGGIEYSEYTGIVSPAYTVLASVYPIEDNFYKQLFKSVDYINRLNIAVYGIRDGKQISYDDFGRIKIPYPPLEEQKAIAAVLTTADKEIEILKQAIEQEKQKKKALMQLLLTGIVRV